MTTRGRIAVVVAVAVAGCSLPMPGPGQRYELEVEFSEAPDHRTAWEHTSDNAVRIAELIAAVKSPPIVAVVVARSLVELAQATGAFGVEAVRNARRIRRVVEPAVGPDLSRGEER